MNTPRISRAVALEQLRPPETDVREHRDERSIRSLAASMGDPSVGQLQDVLVHPVDPEQFDDDIDAQQLYELHRDGHEMRIVDGETRRLAAEHLGWHSLDATIVPAPPENTTIAQLDANTERIDMSGYETCRALYEHYEQTDSTLADMQEKTGFSPGYLSEVFGLFDAPQCVQDAWKHPDHPLGPTHAIDVARILNESTVQQIAAAGDLDEHEAYERALEDVRLMIDVQGEHDLAAGEFRKRCKRCVKETRQGLEDSRSHQERTADGQQSAAEQAAATGAPTETPDRYCRVCGDPADRKIALDVCNSDYGMLSDMKARGEQLLEQADSPETPPQSPDSTDSDTQAAVDAVSQALDLPPEQASAALQAIAAETAQDTAHAEHD